MTLTYIPPSRVYRVPEQRVYLDRRYRPDLWCMEVSADATGHTARLRWHTARFDSNRAPFLTGEVRVEARNDGEPWRLIFVGAIDQPDGDLATESVEFTAHSWLWWLLGRTLEVRADANVPGLAQAPAAVFATGTTKYFLGRDPYSTAEDRPVWYWQPYTILQELIRFLGDEFFATKVAINFDNRIDPVPATTAQRYRYELNESSQVELITETVFRSGIPDQVVHATTWGQVFNWLVEFMPGVQVYEYFDPNGERPSQVWFAKPSDAPALKVQVGVLSRTIRDVGATVADAQVVSSSVQTYDRICAHGGPASCVVTLLSEDEFSPGYLRGLVPDWQIIDPSRLLSVEGAGPPAPLGIMGASAWNPATNAYSLTSIYHQPIYDVVANPELAEAEGADRKPGYETVGRRWRLPAWFTFASLDRRGEDLFTDARTGDPVSYQVFVEVAVAKTRSTPYAAGEAVPHHYEWQRYDKRTRLDPRSRTLDLETVPTTAVLASVSGAVRVTSSRKLCRVALTFVYGHENHSLYADSAVGYGFRQRGPVGTGNVLWFERPDLGYGQVTNINLPLYRTHNERVPVEPVAGALNAGKVYQTQSGINPVSSDYQVVYDEHLAYAVARDATNIVLSRQLTLPDSSLAAFFALTEDALDTPAVWRDDSLQLWKAVRDQFEANANRARSFRCALTTFVPTVGRSLQVRFSGLANYEPREDVVDTVIHNLEDGQTEFTTTNKRQNTVGMIPLDAEV